MHSRLNPSEEREFIICVLFCIANVVAILLFNTVKLV